MSRHIGYWTVTPISELCEAVIDCVNKTAPVVDSATPFRMIRTTNVRNGRVDTGDVRYVDEATYQKWSRRGELRDGDIVLTREAPLGEVGLLRQAEGIFLGQRLVMYRADRSRADNRFLAYALQSPWVQAEIRSLGSGSTVEHMRVPDCERISVPNPPLDVQRKIGGALGAFDDLIENNRRRIEILEGMVRLIYREWFVHFRFPGYEDLGLVDSDLGPIPEGWEVTTLAEHVELKRRNVNPADSPDEKFDHYSIPAFDADGLPTVEDGAEIKSGKYELGADCVLLSKLNPRFARVWRVRPGRSVRRSICSTEFLVLEATHDWPEPFVFSLVRDSNFGAQLASMAGGTSTSHQRAKPNDVMGLLVAEPPAELIATFCGSVRQMLDLADNLILQNAVLSKTRDLLIPPLISGELDVSYLDLDLEPVA